MKFIAHRGLFQGPDKDKENNPDQICEALGKGFDVEIDLRCDESNNLFLGHDCNQYPISKDFLLEIIEIFGFIFKHSCTKFSALLLPI